MASEVYFTNMNCAVGDSLLKKTDRLLRKAGMTNMDLKGKFVALKIHFGERGNLSSLRPNYAKTAADIVKEMGGMPFLTDCNTLYVGKRKNALDHLDTANLNGFSPVSAGCQIIIADGLKGDDDLEIPIDGEYVKTAKIGRAICDADAMITLTHFKCHELAGFGGAMKNIAMGCGSRRGKMEMHSAGKPIIRAEKCVGCGRCIAACPFDAVAASMDESNSVLNAKIVEYAAAAMKGKECFHMAVIADVSPFCDCHGGNDVPVVPNIGILASRDPVALDRACADLVQKQIMIPGSLLWKNSGGEKPSDVFACVQPASEWRNLFAHAEKMGLGNGEYILMTVD